MIFVKFILLFKDVSLHINILEYEKYRAIGTFKIVYNVSQNANDYSSTFKNEWGFDVVEGDSGMNSFYNGLDTVKLEIDHYLWVHFRLLLESEA